MNRRTCLRAGVSLLPTVGLAGCSGDGAGDTTDATDATDAGGSPATTTGTESEKPDGIYVQSFVESMHVVGTETAGDYGVALMFAVPHTFWNVNGSNVVKTAIEDDDDVHLMAAVWDRETRTVIPETGLSIDLARDGTSVWEEVVYPMLSERMGFHYGANVQLPGDGTYDATVSIGAPPIERTGEFAGRFEEPASTTFSMEFSGRTRSDVSTRPVDQAGKPGAIEPMSTSFPIGIAPAPEDLPGTVHTTAVSGRRARSDDCEFVVAVLPDGNRFTDGGPYLAVVARSRYNGLVVPAMALEYDLRRGGESVASDTFARTLDSEIGYHYGAGVPGVRSGDRLRLSVSTVPQTARHEGYERAMLQMDDVTLEL